MVTCLLEMVTKFGSRLLVSTKVLIFDDAVLIWVVVKVTLGLTGVALLSLLKVPLELEVETDVLVVIGCELEFKTVD